VYNNARYVRQHTPLHLAALNGYSKKSSNNLAANQTGLYGSPKVAKLLLQTKNKGMMP